MREDVRDAYDAIAAAYASDRGDGAADEHDLVAELAADLEPDSRVLDAGCGQGSPPLAALPDSIEVVGVDLSIEQLDLANERFPDAQFARADLSRLPLDANAVDGIVSLFAIIHVPVDDHPAVFEEFARVLRPGGWFVVATMPGPWTGSNPDWLDTGVEMKWSFPSIDGTKKQIRDAGFDVRRSFEITDSEEPAVLIASRLLG